MKEKLNIFQKLLRKFEKNDCKICKKPLNDFNRFRCSYCKRLYCDKHRLPENHSCKSSLKRPKGGHRVIYNKGKTEVISK